jgi:hypothetical protein
MPQPRDIPRARNLRARPGISQGRNLWKHVRGNETVSSTFLLLASQAVTLDAGASPSASEPSIASGSPPHRYPEWGLSDVWNTEMVECWEAPGLRPRFHYSNPIVCPPRPSGLSATSAMKKAVVGSL